MKGVRMLLRTTRNLTNGAERLLEAPVMSPRSSGTNSDDPQARKPQSCPMAAAYLNIPLNSKSRNNAYCGAYKVFPTHTPVYLKAQRYHDVQSGQ